MVLRVRPTPTPFPTNILYTPVDNIPLNSIVCDARKARCCNELPSRVTEQLSHKWFRIFVLNSLGWKQEKLVVERGSPG